MNNIIGSIKLPCDKCEHRIRAYCKGYGMEIKNLDIKNCKKRKTKLTRK